MNKWNPWPWPIFILLGSSLGVNGVIIYHALDSYRPLVTNQAYEEGLKHQQVIDQELRFLHHHWQVVLTQRSAPESQQLFTTKIVGPNNSPVSGIELSMSALRPNAAAKDRVIQFTESPELGGHYVAQVPALQSGLWLLNFILKEKDGRVSRHSTRYMAP